jgi:hypothetical protein
VIGAICFDEYFRPTTATSSGPFVDTVSHTSSLLRVVSVLLMSTDLFVISPRLCLGPLQYLSHGSLWSITFLEEYVYGFQLILIPFGALYKAFIVVLSHVDLVSSPLQ